MGTGTDGVERGRIVCFLMGDLEGSSAHWLSDSNRMDRALQAHDALVRTTVDSGGGVVFKHTGDGFIAQFDQADAAVASAREIRDGLDAMAPELGEFLGCRLAVDVGWATPRDGDWFGPTVNRVARLTDMATTQGLLMSRASVEMLRELPDDLVDLGDVVLKSHVASVPVVALGGASLASGSRAGLSLPVVRTEFVGRHQEIDDVNSALDQHRLVTLCGQGGAGKTRLALEVATRRAAQTRVGFADLVPTESEASVARTLAIGVGIEPEMLAPQSSPTALVDALVRHVGDRWFLLLVDNCEHVLLHVAGLLDRALGACHGLSVLATSRQPTEVHGEYVWPVPTFTAAPELLRARAAAHGVVLDSTEIVETAVEQICDRLDGLPLAIELAAGHLVTLSLRELLDDLAGAMSVPVGAASVHDRHRTLFDTVRWSYERLEDSVRHGFRRISLLEGSFRRTDAELVLAGSSETLDHLVRCSLLVRERDGLDVTFRMLEPVRQAAMQLLREVDEFDDSMEMLRENLLALADGDYGDGYWQWAALERLRPLLPTVWSVGSWLDDRGDHVGQMQLLSAYSGAALVFGDADRAQKVLGAHIDEAEVLAVDDHARILVSYALCGIGSMELTATTAAVVKLFSLEFPGDSAPAVFAHRIAALGAMNDAFAKREDDAFALGLLEAARNLIPRTSSLYEQAGLAAFSTWAQMLAGRWSLAAETARDGCAIIGTGNVWHMLMTANGAQSLVMMGEADEALRMVADHPDRHRYSYWGDVLGYAEVLALDHRGDEQSADSCLGSLITQVLATTHRGHRSDVAVIAAFIAGGRGRLDFGRELLAHTFSFRGPYMLSLTRPLEKRLDVVWNTPPVDDRTAQVDASERRLEPLLQRELERIQRGER